MSGTAEIKMRLQISLLFVLYAGAAHAEHEFANRDRNSSGPQGPHKRMLIVNVGARAGLAVRIVLVEIRTQRGFNQA